MAGSQNVVTYKVRVETSRTLELPKNVVGLFQRFLWYLTEVRKRTEKTAKDYVFDLGSFWFYVVGGAERTEELITTSHQGKPKPLFKLAKRELPEPDLTEESVVKLLSVSRETVLGFQQFLSARYSVATVGRKCTAVRTFFQFCKKRGYIASTPFKGVRYPGKKKAGNPQPLPLEELARLSAHLNQLPGWRGARDAAILAVFCSTGVRTGELVALNWNDLVRDGGSASLLVRHGHKVREVALSDGALAALASYAAALRLDKQYTKFDCVSMFLNKHGHRINERSVRRNLKRRAAETGLAISPCDLRATMAVNFFAGGGKLEDAQKVLGLVSHSVLCYKPKD